MRIIKIITFLILFLILACGQNPEREARNKNFVQSVSGQSKEEQEILKKNKEPEENLIINDSTIIENQAQNEPELPENQVERTYSDNENLDKNSGGIGWKIGSIVSIILNLILFFLLRKTLKSKKHYKERKIYYKDESNRLGVQLQQITADKNSILQDHQKNRERHISKQKNTVERKQFSESISDEVKSPEVVWPINNTTPKLAQHEEKQSVSLFAEKATEENTFSNVSDQQNDHRSIFKLSLDSEQAETAQFEVIDSDFILKMVANSPDTYLYKVCKPENSNQNFAGEIITVQKGIAHKVDGKWQVKDENKAKIKFQ